MWKYLQRRVSNHPKVRNLSQDQRKRVGGKFIKYSTLMLTMTLVWMMISSVSPWMHVIIQTIWGVSMIIGFLIAFEPNSGEKAVKK